MNALIGVVLIGWFFGFRLYLARMLRRQGRPVARAWRGAWINPMLVFGLLFILHSVNATAAEVYFGCVMLGYFAVVIWLIVKGVRSAPEMWRRVKAIGDPEAWRGNYRA